MRCSSVDPLPSRRRWAVAVLIVLVLGILLVVLGGVQRHNEDERAESSGSFTAPRPAPAAVR